MDIFENIYLNKINKNTYTINKISKGKLSKYTFKSPLMYLPFGIEEYKNKFIVNGEFTNYLKNPLMKDFLLFIEDIDTFFEELETIKCKDGSVLDLKEKTYSPLIRRRGKFAPQLRTHIKKNKNKIITECKKGENAISLFDIEKKSYAFLEIEISSLWCYSDNYGILLNVNSLTLLSK